MLNLIILHCPACLGALNVPTNLTSTLFKTYEISLNYNYSYGSEYDNKLNAHLVNAYFSRNFNRFSIIAVIPYTYSISQIQHGDMDMIDKLNSLYGLDIGIRYFPIYSRFSKYRNILSILILYKLPIGFYELNEENHNIVDYISVGIGYAFVYNKLINYSEVTYSKALKEEYLQSDKARFLIGSYYTFNRFELGPIINYMYQKVLNSHEITLGLSYGFNVLNSLVNLNIHRSVYYKGDGISNDILFELILRGGI